MTIDEVDDFLSVFGDAPGPARRMARQERAKKERLTQKPEKRNKIAVRTTQINFRCSPEFKRIAVEEAHLLDKSVSDLMEILLNNHRRQRLNNAG